MGAGWCYIACTHLVFPKIGDEWKYAYLISTVFYCFVLFKMYERRKECLVMIDGCVPE